MSDAREIRPLDPNDALRHRELMAQAFGRGGVVTPPAPAVGASTAQDAPPPDMANKWGLFAGGELQASLTIVPFHTHWGAETVLPLGGIAGVATWAHARGNGYVTDLLTDALRTMKERGEVVSALYPFAWGFYRKFGWDWVGEKHTVTLPLRELRAAPEGRRVRDITQREAINAKPHLEAAYTNYAREYRGVFNRETHQWKNTLAHRDNRTTFVYQYEPTGEYLLWRYDGEKGRITEWTARTPEGMRAHLSLLHYLHTQYETAEVVIPHNSPLPAHIMHWNMETKTWPVFMGRVVDFAGAIQALPPVRDVPNASLTLALHDEHAPWNKGVWEIGVENEGISCEKARDGVTADVTMDIQAVSQAFWGTPSLQWLRNAGRVDHVADEAAFALLSRLLPAHPVYTLDDF